VLNIHLATFAKQTKETLAFLKKRALGIISVGCGWLPVAIKKCQCWLHLNAKPPWTQHPKEQNPCHSLLIAMLPLILE
jgi:hypothetical protein